MLGSEAAVGRLRKERGRRRPKILRVRRVQTLSRGLAAYQVSKNIMSKGTTQERVGYLWKIRRPA